MVEGEQNNEEYHELTVRYSFDNIDNTYLNNTEVIKNVPVNLKLYIKNTGKKEFPGGNVEQCYFEFSNMRGDIDNIEKEILSIKINEEILVYEENDFVIKDEGSAWLYLYLSSKDKLKIKYCQEGTKGPLELDYWVNTFTSYNKTDFIIINSLDNIKELLTKILDV